MKIFLLILLTVAPMVFSQEIPPAGSQPQSGPGPGKSLPANSKEMPPPNLTGLRERAMYVADQIKEQSRELVSFLAIIALIYAGYHAQFRGLQEFVSTLFRMVAAFSLLTAFKEFIPAFFEARKQLLSSLPVSAVDASLQVGTMIGSVGIGSLLMGPAGIGLVVTTILAALGILIIYSAQILFEAVLIAFAPLAIACLAFQHSSGIFTAWLKTFIALLLIPVGWTLAMILGSNVFGWNGDSLAENSADMVASLIYIAAAGAIYMGMPVLTVWLVNKASGAAAGAMPSSQQIISFFSGFTSSAINRGGGMMPASIPQSSMSSGGGLAAIPAATPVISSAQTLLGSYGDRIRTAQKHHKS